MINKLVNSFLWANCNHMLHPLPDLTTSKKLTTELVTIYTLMQDSNIRLYDSLYSGGIPRLLQAQNACLNMMR